MTQPACIEKSITEYTTIQYMDTVREKGYATEFQSSLKKQGLSKATIRLFRRMIYYHYKKHGRELPWRMTDNSYHIYVSEVMLQQTQVERVIRKYEEFIAAFPDASSLAKAPLRKLLSVWTGMGYNRRAIALRESAKKIVNEYKGMIPSSVEELITFPGIGNATASSIAAFAFNKPTVFIETNIRRVFIHFFFQDRDGIHDNDILPLVEKTLDRKKPGTWYNALMDYGTRLKQTGENPNRRSVHYAQQTRFEGSNRQIRGAILRVLHEKNMSVAGLKKELNVEPGRLGIILQQLQNEGFIRPKGRYYTIV